MTQKQNHFANTFLDIKYQVFYDYVDNAFPAVRYICQMFN